MSKDVGSLSAETAVAVELVHGREFLYFFTDADFPEPDVLRELRLATVSRYRAATLGPSDLAATFQTVAEYAEAGLIGNVAYHVSASTLKYLNRLAQRPRSMDMGTEDAMKLASDVYARAVRRPRGSTTIKVSEATKSRRGWRILLTDGDTSAEVFISSRGVVSLKVASLRDLGTP